MESVMSTYMAKKEEVKRGWVLVDLKDQVLGRAATNISNILRGKHRPTYTPNVDTGDFVVAVNAAKIKLTGNKWDDKEYHRHSGYMGGLKTVTAKKLIDKDPEELLIRAVKGMLPKSYLGKKMLKKLKIYPGPEHGHEAQIPKEVK